jgi:hypothetical protein
MQGLGLNSKQGDLGLSCMIDASPVIRFGV